jgi:biopolymer transport protein ExbD
VRSYLPHTAAMSRRRRAGEEAVVARLQLPSLIDIFTVLLLFLLKGLVVGGAVVTPFPGVALPPSSASGSFRESPVLVVTKQQVVVDGAAACATTDVEGSGSLKIDAIETALIEVRARSERIAEKSATRRFEGKLIVQADESIPFHVLQKIMYTSQTVGFYDITLAVIQK